MKINNNTIPSPMALRGTYKFEPAAVLRRNGQGAAITGPYATLTWTWDWLSPAEFQFWTVTVLANAASASFTANTELYDDSQLLRTISHCTVLRPTYESIENGGYRGAAVQIDQITMVDWVEP